MSPAASSEKYNVTMYDACFHSLLRQNYTSTNSDYATYPFLLKKLGSCTVPFEIGSERVVRVPCADVTELRDYLEICTHLQGDEIVFHPSLGFFNCHFTLDDREVVMHLQSSRKRFRERKCSHSLQ